MHKFGLLVSYRDRKDNLDVFVPHMSEWLENNLKDVDWHIYIAEQSNDGNYFNKGRCINAAFSLSQKCGVDYICQHDVDMIPVDDKCDYSWSDSPIHLAVHVEQFGWKLNAPTYWGGAILLKSTDYVKANGFSNNYWGWGSEDIDFGERIIQSGNSIGRPRKGRYRSLPHKKHKWHLCEEGINKSMRQKNATILRDLREGNYDFRNEGLNSHKFNLIDSIEINERTTKFLVEFDKKEATFL